ncbi:MAG TPA: flagellar assembly protein FliH [Povalibacter sp.]|nr:flagellar assembly protein FliH [Povalibacter sp.]
MNATTATATDQVALWDLPTVSGKSVQVRRTGPTVGELEAIEQKAHQEAYAAGRAEGLAAARAESEPQLTQLKAQVQRMSAIFDQLARPLENMDAQVEQQLVNLALAIAKQLVRRELKTDPTQVIAVVRETVGLLPASARDVRVHLHPEDAAVVREKLATPSADRAWSIVEDPVMTRGGCRVTTDTAQIDARLETRIGGVISAILGDERAAARVEEPGAEQVETR